MAHPSRCLRAEEYTIGWISALHIELAAGLQMLDEIHHSPLPLDPDAVVYRFGRLGAYNVVLGCLPDGQYGTNSAAAVARSMQIKFSGLRFCLLVGIGGGVPEKHDVRLGDVVVSKPTQNSGGIVQYDIGKNTPSGFERTGALNSPPITLLQLLSSYRAANVNLKSVDSQISHTFQARVTKGRLPTPPAEDLLFKPDYDHCGGDTCANCDKKQLITRTPRRPLVHYGLIGSGNQVIKDARTRDALSSELGGVLCFEMEAAGIMNTLPCLVIRGICDYADSHKAKHWQLYAASIAAAYAKELFSLDVPATDSPNRHSTSITTISSRRFSRPVSAPKVAMEGLKKHSQDLVEQDHFLRHKISQYDPLRNYWNYSSRRCPGTTDWILEHDSFQEWLKGGNMRCLWLTAKIGAGKTLITSTVIKYLLESKLENESEHVVLHYFYSHTQKDGLTAKALADSLTQQLLDLLEVREIDCPAPVAACLRKFYGRSSISPRVSEVMEMVLFPLVSTLNDASIVIDGIDECEMDEVFRIFELLRNLSKIDGVKLFVSSRANIDVLKAIPGTVGLNIPDGPLQKDIETYIDWKVARMLADSIITENEDLLKDIKITLAKKAEGMILWVKLQIESIWEDCACDGDIRNSLLWLPKDLNGTYDRCFARIESQKGVYARKHAWKLLPWIFTAERPLTVIELRQALAIDDKSGLLKRDQMPPAQEILRSCANLVVLEGDQAQQDGNDARFATVVHHSLRNYVDRVQAASSSFWKETKLLFAARTMALAQLCIIHLLSEDYSVALKRTETTGNVSLDLPQVGLLTSYLSGPLPNLIRWTKSVMPVRPQPRATRIVLPLLQDRYGQHGLPAIFHYARDQWAPLTRSISPDSKYSPTTQDRPLYDNFAKLASSPNFIYNFHPWNLGQSHDSHFTGMLAWSIVNDHFSLQVLAFQNLDFITRKELLFTPIPKYGGENVLALAIRHDNVWVLDGLQFFKDAGSSGKGGLYFEIPWNVLFYAIEAGSAKIITRLDKEHLLGALYNIWFRENGLLPLVCTASSNHVAATRALLRSIVFTGPMIPEHIQEFISARNTAIAQGLVEILKAFEEHLDNYPSQRELVNISSDDLEEYMRYVIQSENPEAIPYLIKKGYCKIEWLDSGANNLALLRALLKNKEMPEIAAVAQDMVDEALQQAISKNDKTTLEELLVMGADPFILNPSSWRAPIHIAAKEASSATLQLCIDHSSKEESINVRDRDGCTALMLAALYGNYENVEVLLKCKRIDRPAINTRGETAYQLCRRSLNAADGVNVEKYQRCLRLLLIS